MSNKMDNELLQRNEELLAYMETIGSALKRRSIGGKQEAVKAHEKHVTSVRMTIKRMKGETF